MWTDNMGWREKMRATLATAAAFLVTLCCPPAVADPNWEAVGKALGKAGAVLPDGIYRVGLPRSDLKVVLDGVVIKPALALGSWVAFEAMSNDAMVMGDLVLTEDEVEPVMKSLIEGGIDITAPQPSAALAADNLLPACERTWRSAQIGRASAHGPCPQQDTAWAAKRKRGVTNARPRYLRTR
jgi:hypothetical protein